MKKFNELNLSEPIMKAILELGYEATTPIQAEALPLLLGKDTDFLGLAATGTGKTAAFGIPLLERLDKNTRGVQALILCPTRELAIQVAGQLDLLGKFLGVKALPVYGGTGYGDQIYGLKNGATIVVGTPGRVVDHLNKGTLVLSQLKTLVLDEADEMISMGFKEDLELVLEKAPKDQANIWLFSATMGGEVRHVADAYLTNPTKVQINRTEMLPATVEQLYYKTHEYDKPEVLCKLIEAADDFYGIVFCQTKALVNDLHQYMLGRGYKVDCLHGDLDQTNRDRVMKAFRDRKLSILIATDVACRGLDVKDITHVVNYSIPRELDNYVHRIGRTGRSGKTGIAMSLVTFSHRELIGRIERMTKSRMKEGFVPTGKEIALKKINKLLSTFDAQGPQGRVEALLGDDWKKSLEALSKEDIAARFLTLINPEFSAVHEQKKAGPLTERPAPRFDHRPERSDRPDRAERRTFSANSRPPRRDAGFKPNFAKPRSAPPWEKKPFGDRPAFSARGDKAPARRFRAGAKDKTEARNFSPSAGARDHGPKKPFMHKSSGGHGGKDRARFR